MLRARFDMEALAADSEAVACVVPGSGLFSWRTRALVVPAGWIALSTRPGQDPQLAHAGQRLEGEETLDVLLVRAMPVACNAGAADLQSTDGHACTGSIRLHVRVMPEPAELAAFRRTVMGSSDQVRVGDLERHLQWPMHEVLSELASRYSAAELTTPLEASVVRVVADDKLQATCLAGGLSIEGAIAAHFDSPAYLEHCRQQNQLSRQRQRATTGAQIQDALAAAQAQRLTNLVQMLERLRQAGEAQGDVPLASLLTAFNESERGQLYAALWHLRAASPGTRFVAVVSGQQVLWFDPARMTRPVRQTTVPDYLGPLRSIAVDRQSLPAGVALVGAATGIHLLEIESGQLRQSLPAVAPGGCTVRGGVNAAAMSSEHVLATHSELGLLAWARQGLEALTDARGSAESAGPMARQLLGDLTAGANTVRGVQVAEGAVWLAVDDKLWSLDEADLEASRPVLYAGSQSTLSAVAVFEGTVYAGNVEGQILAWAVGEPQSARVIRGSTGNPVESIDVVDAGGVDRLIVADRGSALLALVVGDTYVCRYESGGLPVRRAAAAEDIFVAMNDNRDRLMVWDPRMPTAPTGTVIVPHLTGNSIQDLGLIPDRQTHPDGGRK